MSESEATPQAELIQALHRAARIERAETVRRLLRTLLQRRGEERIGWPSASQPAATGNCR